jgi:PAS domain S-box-containing protein
MRDTFGAIGMAGGDSSLAIDALQTQLASMLGEPPEAFPTLVDSIRRVRMLEATLETVPVGVIVAAVPSGQIIFANRHVQRVTGHGVIYSENIAAYRDWTAYHANGSRVQPDEWPIARVILERVPQAELEFEYERGDGNRRWIRAVAKPICDPAGDMIAATVVLIDIDDQHRREDVQRLVISELNHRAKNMLAVVKSIVSQTLRRENVGAGVIDKVSDRLDAYARAHAQLNAQPGRSAPLADIVSATLRGAIDEGRLIADGPVCLVPERAGLALSMALHELATNALKHGAWSAPGGTVSLSWSLAGAGAERTLTMHWQERGGPRPKAPDSGAEKGFGSIIIDRALTMQTRGTVEIAYPREGFRWTLTAPLPET